MDAGIFIPLAAFLAVVLIVGLINVAGLHDREMRTRESLNRAEMDHRARIAELDHELAKLRQGA